MILSYKPLPFCLFFVLFFLIFYLFLFRIFSSWIWSHYLFFDCFFLYFPIFRAQKLRTRVQGSQGYFWNSFHGKLSTFLHPFSSTSNLQYSVSYFSKRLIFKYIYLVLLCFILFLEGKVINLLFLLPFFLLFFIFLGCKISSISYTIDIVFQFKALVWRHVNIFAH